MEGEGGDCFCITDWAPPAWALSSPITLPPSTPPEPRNRLGDGLGREIVGDAAFLFRRGGVDQPHQQEEGHHRGHEVGIGDFPGAAMMAAMPALLDAFDNDGVVAGHLTHLLLLQPNPYFYSRSALGRPRVGLAVFLPPRLTLWAIMHNSPLTECEAGAARISGWTPQSTLEPFRYQGFSRCPGLLSHRHCGDDGRSRPRRPISGSPSTALPRCRWTRLWCCGASTGARAAIRPFAEAPGFTVSILASGHKAVRRVWREQANIVWTASR